MDTLDSTISALDNGLAIVSNNNTHGAITAGQYVYVRNHGSLAEGMYTANSNIAANATLSSSNLTAASSGSLNKLNSDLDALNSKVAASNDTVVSNIEGVKSALQTFAASLNRGESKLVTIVHTNNSETNIMRASARYSGYLHKTYTYSFSWLATNPYADVISISFDGSSTWTINNCVPSALTVELGNFDKPTKTFMRMMTTSSGTSPAGVLQGNQFIIISMSPDDGAQQYNAQIAFGFGADAIAIRRKNGSTTWSSWKAIS